MKSINYIKSFVFFLAMILFLDIILLIIVDPYRTFNLVPKKHNLYSTDTRLSSFGILNNAQFDSIILGTSMLQSIDPLYANKILDGSFINISASNGAISYRSKVLEYALNQKKLKHVIFSVDGFYDSNEEFDKGEGFAKYYIGFRCLKYIPCWFFNCSNYRDINRLVEWPNSYEDYFGSKGDDISVKRKKSLNKLINSINSPPPNYNERVITINSDREFINKNLTNLIEKFPDTKFHLIFPPYSRIKYAVWKQKSNNYELYKRRITLFVEEHKDLSNVLIYGFDDEFFLDNLNNYMDDIHHHPKFNYLQIDSIKNKENILTMNNLDDYLFKIDELSSSYNLGDTLLNLKEMVKK